MNFRTDKLKKTRKEKMTQQKFAESINISYEHYTKIENSYNKPSVPVFLDICSELNKSAQYFFTDEEMFLSCEQFDKLMQYDDKRLQLVLNLLQELYENCNTSL